jgi:hypothetical protein
VGRHTAHFSVCCCTRCRGSATTATGDGLVEAVMNGQSERGLGLRAVVKTGGPTPPLLDAEELEGKRAPGSQPNHTMPPVLWPSYRQQLHPECCLVPRNTKTMLFKRSCHYSNRSPYQNLDVLWMHAENSWQGTTGGRALGQLLSGPPRVFVTRDRG